MQVNPRTKEKNARKIKFIKEGPPPARDEGAEQKLPPRVVHERPASTQFQNKTQAKEVRLAKGPDGTRGFVNVGRGRRVGPPNTVLEARIGQKVKGNLNVEAQPFVPLGLKLR